MTDPFKKRQTKGGSQKLLLTTKESIVSAVVFFLDHPVYSESHQRNPAYKQNTHLCIYNGC